MSTPQRPHRKKSVTEAKTRRFSSLKEIAGYYYPGQRAIDPLDARQRGSSLAERIVLEMDKVLSK